MPFHNVAFNEAAAFVSERYKVRMVNITSLVVGEEFFSNEVLGRKDVLYEDFGLVLAKPHAASRPVERTGMLLNHGMQSFSIAAPRRRTYLKT